MLDLGNLFGGKNPFGNVAAPAGCYSDVLVIYARNLILVLLVGLIVVAVFMVIVVAFRVITSGGVADAIQEGFGGLKNILIGLVATFAFLVVLYFVTMLIWPTAGAAIAC